MRRLLLSFLLPILALSIPGARAGGAQTAPSTAPAAGNAKPSENPLIELLKSKDAGVRARAARDLGKQRDTSAIPALAAAVTDSSQKVRRDVVVALAEMHDASTFDGLITATKDREEDVSVLAVRSLVGYYTGNVPSTGVAGFVKKSWRRAESHFTVDNTRVDPGVVIEPKVVAALDGTMKDPRSGHAAPEAAKGLGILVARQAVPDLVSAAHSSNADLSLEALNALTKIKERSAGPQLVDLLDSPNKDVKRNASVTVGVLRAEPALPKLQAIFESDPDPKDKENALEGLAYLGEKPSVPTFTKALWSDDKNLRTSAAEGLARAADPGSLPELEKAVAIEKDANVKLAVEFAITALGKMDYLSALVNDLGTRGRADVAQSYLIELSRNSQFLPRLYPYLQSQDASVRRRLCSVLMYSGDQTSLEVLDRLSHDSNNDVVAEALRARQAIRARLAAPASGGGTSR